MTEVQKHAVTAHKSNNSASHIPDNINPVVAGIVGAAVGAGLGVAGAMAMKNDKVKAKAEEVLKTVGDKATEYAQNMKKEATAQLEEKTGEATEDVKKVMASSKK